MANKENEHLSRYFPHSSNARNTDKLINLRMQHKAAGYGVYFMILERLREEPEYMSVKDYNMIAFDLRVDASLIKSVVEDFGLFVFTEDGKYFYSESFKQRMEIMDSKSKKLSEAGKKGNEKRWGKQSDFIATQSPPDCHPIKKASQIKENKINKNNNPPYSPPVDDREIVYSSEMLSLSELRRIISTDGPWKDVIAMRHGINLQAVNTWIETFFQHLECSGETLKSLKDFKHHFTSWLSIQLSKNQNNGNYKQRKPNTTESDFD